MAGGQMMSREHGVRRRLKGWEEEDFETRKNEKSGVSKGKKEEGQRDRNHVRQMRADPKEAKDKEKCERTLKTQEDNHRLR